MLIFEIQNVSKHALVCPTVFCLCFVGNSPASQGKVDMCLGIEILNESTYEVSTPIYEFKLM
jgi:hypothetical protein